MQWGTNHFNCYNSQLASVQIPDYVLRHFCVVHWVLKAISLHHLLSCPPKWFNGLFVILVLVANVANEYQERSLFRLVLSRRGIPTPQGCNHTCYHSRVLDEHGAQEVSQLPDQTGWNSNIQENLGTGIQYKKDKSFKWSIWSA